MLGQLIDSLDDPKVALDLVAALDEPALLARLAAIADTEGRALAEIVASTVRGFLDSACDDHWLQLVGIMNRAEDPGLSAVRAILTKAMQERAP
jgi:hypothetical protein